MDRQLRPTPLPPALLDLALSQGGALTGTQIARLIGKKRLITLVRAGAITTLWRNAYALPERAPDAGTRMRAAALTMDRPVTACLGTAAQLYGFGLSPDTRTHVMADHDWPNSTSGFVQHRYRPLRAHQSVEGLAVADLAETAVRLACRESDPAKVLAVLDDALRRTGVDRSDLGCVADELHIRGISLTRELIGLADGRAESPGESWLRWVFLEAGFPPATPQIPVSDEYGNTYRIDLGWEDRRVGCEYEGVEFHTGGEALTRDRTRYNALGRQRWLMHGVTHTMIWRDHKSLVADIDSLLHQRPA